MKSLRRKLLQRYTQACHYPCEKVRVYRAVNNAVKLSVLNNMEKTVGPATTMAANAVKWKMDNYWAPLKEAAAMDLTQGSFQKKEPINRYFLQRHF